MYVVQLKQYVLLCSIAFNFLIILVTVSRRVELIYLCFSSYSSISDFAHPFSGVFPFGTIQLAYTKRANLLLYMCMCVYVCMVGGRYDLRLQ